MKTHCIKYVQAGSLSFRRGLGVRPNLASAYPQILKWKEISSPNRKTNREPRHEPNGQRPEW